jgi:two-component system sensor histidine kinase RegB
MQTQLSLTFSWLIKLRWWAILGQILICLLATILFHLEIWIEMWLLVVVIMILSNFYCTENQKALGRNQLHWTIVFDLLMLSLLLMSSGGPSNPFTVLYLVYVALGSITLSSTWIWITCILSNICFTALFFFHVQINPQGNLQGNLQGNHQHHMSHAQTGDFLDLHLQGMLIAFMLTSVLIAYFMAKVSSSLKAKEQELSEMKTIALKNEQLASLTTLAAGAAHELNTPLNTIVVIQNELLYQLKQLPLQNEYALTFQAQLQEDLILMKSEVDRCKKILEKLSIKTASPLGEPFQHMSSSILLTEIEGLIKEHLPVLEAEGLSYQIISKVDDRQCKNHDLFMPKQTFLQAVLAVLQNATYALQERKKTSTPEKSQMDLLIQLIDHDDQLILMIEDQGIGIKPEDLPFISKPFFSTKAVGQGMGLGLFLTRTLMEQLNGRFEIQSEYQKGTLIKLTIPKHLSKNDGSTQK